MSDPGHLTTPAYWERYIRRFRWPRRNDQRRMPWRVVDRVLRRHLPGTPLQVLEVGCAASAWLPYFATSGHACWGMDYSTTGCKTAATNLRHYGARARVWCADLFAPAVVPDRFDVVFSNGFVEHFTDTRTVMRALAALARPGGWIVTVVPNLAGWAGRGFRMVNPEAFAQHLVLAPDELRAAHAAAGLTTLHADYCGVWFPFLWSATDGRFPRGSGFALKVLVHATARPVWALTRMSDRYPESRRGSPWVLAVAQR